MTLGSGPRGYRRYLTNEYARINGRSRSTNSSAPRIDLEIVDQLPVRQQGDIFRRERFKRLFLFSYLIKGVDTDHVTIYFRRHWVDRLYMNAIGVYLQAQVLEPVLYFKLLERGILLMHAGGVTHHGRAVLMPAHGGAGKTTTTMALVAHGYQLLGDDLVFVDVGAGIVQPYPRPFHIFTYNVRNLRGARIPLRYATAVYVKNMLRFVLERALRMEFLISTRVHADELFEGDIFGGQSEIATLAYLRNHGPAIERVAVRADVRDSLIDLLVRSADLNDSLERVFGEDRNRNEYFRRLEREAIATLLSQRLDLVLVNTRALNLDDLSSFSAAIGIEPSSS